MVHEILLVINPGSTSTKLAVFQQDQQIRATSIHHSNEELAKFAKIVDQRSFRENLIIEWLSNEGISLDRLSAIAARGGLLAPLTGGTYYINETMVYDLEQETYGKHASNLAALIAFSLGKRLDIPSFIVDPVVVDELQPLARFSGHPKITRRSIFHALNHKACAKQVAQFLEQPYEELNLIVAHLGGGISVGAHRQGQVIDVNNALSGEGPFSPERAGSIPTVALIRYFFAKKTSKAELINTFVGQSGLVGYLGTNDLRTIIAQLKGGQENALLYFKTMAYQICKEIGRMSAVLEGVVDAIVLTGGLAHSSELNAEIRARVEFIAPLIILPGENELKALALGALRVITGQEVGRQYLGREVD